MTAQGIVPPRAMTERPGMICYRGILFNYKVFVCMCDSIAKSVMTHGIWDSRVTYYSCFTTLVCSRWVRCSVQFREVTAVPSGSFLLKSEGHRWLHIAWGVCRNYWTWWEMLVAAEEASLLHVEVPFPTAVYHLTATKCLARLSLKKAAHL